MSNNLVQLPLVTEASDPIKRFGFQDRTDSDTAVDLYLEGWTNLNDALSAKHFSQSRTYFSKAFGSFLQALQADPHYDCAKLGAVVVGEVLEELGEEMNNSVSSILDGIDYAVSLGNHVGADRCQVLQGSWRFLQKLRSGQHTYVVFDYSAELDLFDKLSESLKKQGEISYSVEMQETRRLFSEMDFEDLQLHVSLEGALISAPGYEDQQKIVLKANGERIVPKLSQLLEQYHFRLE